LKIKEQEKRLILHGHDDDNDDADDDNDDDDDDMHKVILGLLYMHNFRLNVSAKYKAIFRNVKCKA
jgi:hypothetical protein